jgi:leucyl aminopeptidase
MMPQLPPLNSLTVPVAMRPARITERILSRYRAGIMLLPPNIATSAWAQLPHGGILRTLHERKPRHEGDVLSLSVGERAETQLIIAYTTARASTFQRLQLAQKCARAALECEPEQVLIGHALDDAGADQALLALLAALQAAAFPLPSFKSKPKRSTRLRGIDVAHRGKLAGLERSQAGSGGNNLARWLTALPPNELDARGYRRHLQAFASRHGLEFQFYSQSALQRLGAGAFLAVAQGNPRRDAGIARLSYRPRGAKRSVCLVGKGICFDTGGTNLKPHKSMLDMHIDMEGSAVALGSLQALIELQSPIAVDCWLAITENRIGPAAYKPQDIVRAVDGTTIQVIHTDAEGRMVLADTLALAARRKPGAIIDYATLTGACIYALTERYSGAFTNRPESRDAIEAAGARSGERVWCFPMDEDFGTDIDSSVADVAQCAVEGKGDHILAALFLQRFVPKEIPWLHLDLAAGSRHGGLAHIGTDITGFGVRYTLELLDSGWPQTRMAGGRGR